MGLLGLLELLVQMRWWVSITRPDLDRLSSVGSVVETGGGAPVRTAVQKVRSRTSKPLSQTAPLYLSGTTDTTNTAVHSNSTTGTTDTTDPTAAHRTHYWGPTKRSCQWAALAAWG